MCAVAATLGVGAAAAQQPAAARRPVLRALQGQSQGPAAYARSGEGRALPPGTTTCWRKPPAPGRPHRRPDLGGSALHQTGHRQWIPGLAGLRVRRKGGTRSQFGIQRRRVGAGVFERTRLGAVCGSRATTARRICGPVSPTRPRCRSAPARCTRRSTSTRRS